VTADQLRQIADLLDGDDGIFDVAAGAIADSRDKAARHPEDRDSADVLTDVITALRAAANRT
jgi:hypothetical protein